MTTHLAARATLALVGLLAPGLAHPADPPPPSAAACHAASEPVGWVPAEVLQRPVPLRTGIGGIRERVSTRSTEAQAFYDQGLSYLHSYVWIEAARSFHQALRHDPQLAMAYLGLSRAYAYFEPGASRRMLEKAQALAVHASPRERTRLDLRARQIDAIDDPGDVSKLVAYRSALDEALVTGWDDPELWLLRGNAEDPLMGAAGIGQRGHAASVPIYEHVLAMAPDHPAAHHYLVHSYEQVGRIDKALAHGLVYRDAAPEVPHAHHMYGHDLRRVGRTREAIAEFEKADALELAYFARESLPSDLDWHHAHNLDLLAAAYRHQGEMRRAEEILRRALAVDPHVDAREINRKEWTTFLLARGRLEEAAAAALAMSQSTRPASRSIGHALVGEVALARGDRGAAELALKNAQAAVAEINGTLASALRGAASSHIDKLKGQILLRGASAEEGRTLLKTVQARFRARPGPDAWIQALFELEAIARVAREAADWELAEFTARQMLDHDGAYAGSHYALALVLEQQQERMAAARSFAEAARLWAPADENLPELRRARTVAAAAGE
jgi:Tfp pilus assembly protein PilF